MDDDLLGVHLKHFLNLTDYHKETTDATHLPLLLSERIVAQLQHNMSDG
jgi:hypothetical protein